MPGFRRHRPRLDGLHPTAIVPGAHLLSRDNGEWGALADAIKASGTATTLEPSLSEIKLTAPKGQGTAVLLHRAVSEFAFISRRSSMAEPKPGSWGELEARERKPGDAHSGLGLLGMKEKLQNLEIEHALCGGSDRRQKAKIEELGTQNASLEAEKKTQADQVRCYLRHELSRYSGSFFCTVAPS